MQAPGLGAGLPGGAEFSGLPPALGSGPSVGSQLRAGVTRTRGEVVVLWRPSVPANARTDWPLQERFTSPPDLQIDNRVLVLRGQG